MNQESPSQELVPLKKRRTRIPDKPNYSLNLWSIMKNCIGKELSKIPMPVSVLRHIKHDIQEICWPVKASGTSFIPLCGYNKNELHPKKLNNKRVKVTSVHQHASVTWDQPDHSSSSCLLYWLNNIV